MKPDKSLNKFCYDATQGAMQAEFQVPNIPFSVTVYHDEDASGTATKNWADFIPAEGLGFSSGAKLGFGPPSFDDAVMTLPADSKINIGLIYP